MKFNGLTDREVEESRKKHGSNAIPDSEPTTFWQEFKETFGDPMIKILLAIAALMIVMFFFGYAEIYEPLGTIVAVLIVAFVSAKTGVASDTKYRELKDSTKKDQCKVHRNGVVVVIDVDDVVVGDKVLLQAGDKIPADGILISGNLHVDNSALNGEAEECKKTEAPQDFQLADDITGETFVDQHSLFRGAVVFDGEGILDVRKVGLQTMMGKMAEEMQEEDAFDESQYDIDDIILSEYGTTVVGLEMMRSVNEESAEEARKVAIVKSAISTLSFSELEAITHIFDELDGNEGILVASRIADRVGITRSVIVNALRKFESAGVIESRSSGMKGTYIKVVNDVVFDELAELKRKNAK